MAIPLYATVLGQINTYIVANGNNEITANVLNPILGLILDFANNNIGDLDTLTTDEKNSIVESINSLKQNFDDLVNNGVQLYTGINDPNDIPPATYNYADFYMQLDIDSLPIKLWQWNGFEWVDSSSGGVSTSDDVENLSGVPGANVTEALDYIDDNVIHTTGDEEKNGNLNIIGRFGVNGLSVNDNPGDPVHVMDITNDASGLGIDQYLLQATAYANNAGWANVHIRKARGTADSPLAVLNQDIISSWGLRGYATTKFASSSAAFQAIAEENFTDTANGTSLLFQVTPIGAFDARIDVLKLETTGAVKVFNLAGIGTRAIGANSIGELVPITSDNLPEGSTNKYSTLATVMAYVLTGISFATGSAITATDTILSAFGKLQKQITDIISGYVIKDRLLENATVSGSYALDYASYELWNLTLTGTTTFTESNVERKTILIRCTGNFALTFPSGWSTGITGIYLGTVSNVIVVQYFKSGLYKVSIIQPD